MMFLGSSTNIPLNNMLKFFPSETRAPNDVLYYTNDDYV